MTRVDVLVVGGGPAGASTAFALARAGLDVTVLDRAHFPRAKPCAECLSPQAARLLDAMGVLAEVERSAAHLSGMSVRAPNGRVIVADFKPSGSYAPFRDRSLAIRRELLDQMLLDAARSAGAQVREGVRVTDVVRDDDGRVVGVRTNERGREGVQSASLVVGADGLRSVVARRLGVARTRRLPRRIALVAHHRGVEGLGVRGEMHVERDGFVGLADVGGGIATIALVVPATRAREISEHRADFLDRWLAAHPQLAPRVAGSVRLGPVRVTGPFAAHARRVWAPGAALVGDAADFFDPFTGEGVYSALRGGELLSEFAARALGATTAARGDCALAAYDAARRREFGGKWKVERMIGAVVGCAPLMNRAARVLAARRDMADLLAGVTGDFVPARHVLRFGYLFRLFLAPVPASPPASLDHAIDLPRPLQRA